jgi:small neutral amino acid transporter SnatA (MarC family)
MTESGDQESSGPLSYRLLVAAIVAVLIMWVVVMFAFFATSIVSAFNGDQRTTIVAAVIGLIGSIGATVLGVLLSWRFRDSPTPIPVR